MKRFRIENMTSGVDLGVYEGATEGDALDAMARDAGYCDYAEALEMTDTDPEDDGLQLFEIS